MLDDAVSGPAPSMGAPAIRVHSPIQSRLGDLYERYRGDDSGQVATYIPELAKADPSQFGIALATLDGFVYEAGDARSLFTIQSISKPFVYGLALEDHGSAEVLRRIGVEPSGDAFNSVVFDERGNRPFNPMVNAGAIATCALIKGSSLHERLGRVLDLFARFTGRIVDIDEDVYRSEKATGHRNRAIAYLELNAGMLSEPVDDHLDLYFKQCSILVNARDLAVMAATLANDGINPLTGDRAMSLEHVQSVLSVMQSCGMYDFSGEWGFRVGLPAKSGVGGGILAALPGQVGIGTFSPPLDERGNSVRGVRACREFSESLNLHIFGSGFKLDSVVRRDYSLREVRSKRSRSASEAAILDRDGDLVKVWELQGPLGVAAIERVSRTVVTRMDEGAGHSHIVFDGRRVPAIDPAAAALTIEIAAQLQGVGCDVLLAGFAASCLIVLQRASESPLPSYESVAEALEVCEDFLLLRARGTAGGEGLVPMRDLELFSGFNGREVERLSAYLTVAEFGPGASIVHYGEASDAIFAVARGLLSVTIPIDPQGRRKTLGTMGPGVTFGELALFEAGPRTASVCATTAALCYRLGLDDLTRLAEAEPALYTKLVVNVGRSLSQRLRRANAEITALEA